MKFKDYEYTRPDVDALLDELDKVVEVIANAETADQQIEAYLNSDKIMSEYNSMSSIVHIRNTMNTLDEYYAEEQAFFDKQSPLVRNKMKDLAKVMSESKFRAELEEKLGDFVMEKLEYQIKGMDASIIPLMQEENALKTEYFRIYSSAQIPFQGGTYTVEQMPPFKCSTDREVRRAAWAAEGAFFDSHREELDTIYDKLVKNRNEQARLMGYKDYTELAVIRMRRYGYGPKEVKAFRKQVAEDLVPLVTKMKKLQAARIGVGDDFKAYDNLVMFPDANPTPKGTPEELLDAATEMYHKLSPETAEFFDFMMENGLLDVHSREGKAPGGYCSSIDKYKAPFIFSNFNGSTDDIDVLTHEAGHAFECYTSYKQEDISLNRLASMETAEVHSMSMEFLTQDYHELLMKEDTAKYEILHAENALSFIPYASIIDAFQYSAYENPDWTPEERHLEWKRLLEEYQPHVTDYEDIPFYSRYAGWQYKLHTYMHPLYYIDYALAQVVAFQFWLLFLEDKDLAWEKYKKFVESSGKRRFADTVKYVGLQSPFEDGCVKNVAEKVYKWIEEHQL